MQFAEAHFALSKPDIHQEGKTRLQVFLDIHKQTGRIAPELLRLPDIPQAAQHVWGWFCDLSVARRHGYDGPEWIGWDEIAAYFDLIRVKPENWEVFAIRQIDIAYMKSRSENGAVVTDARALTSLVRGGER